jgi:hypothetical protein
VLHRSTTWFTRHPRDSRANHSSSGATISSSSHSSSTVTLLPLRSSREQLGHHNRQHQLGYPCYSYGKVGHFTKECHLPRQANSPRTPAPVANQQRSQQRGPMKQSSYAIYTTVEEIPMGEEVLMGMFFLNEHPIIILFDSRASHNFVSSTCAKRTKLTLVASEVPYVISTPGG